MLYSIIHLIRIRIQKNLSYLLIQIINSSYLLFQFEFLFVK